MQSPEAGETVSFEGGATRSESKPRYELCPVAGHRKAAERFTMGAVKHGDNNWKQGGAEFKAETMRHLVEHCLLLAAGDKSDDHLAAVICNGYMLADMDERGV